MSINGFKESDKIKRNNGRGEGGFWRIINKMMELILIVPALSGLGIIWIIYGYPVKAFIKELENENLKLRIKLKEVEDGKKESR